MQKSEQVTPEEFSQVLTVSKSTLYRWEKDRPGFPQRVIIGQRISYWRRHEVEAFIKSVKGEAYA